MNALKIAQKEYKTWHDWMGKGIHRKFCEELKFDDTTKWYMYKLESILDNEMHKIVWDFKIQAAQLKSP